MPGRCSPTMKGSNRLSIDMAAGPVEVRIIRRRRWGAWLLGAVVLLAIAIIVVAGARARIIDVDVFFHYLTSGEILLGAWSAILVGTVSMAVALRCTWVFAPAVRSACNTSAV